MLGIPDLFEYIWLGLVLCAIPYALYIRKWRREQRQNYQHVIARQDEIAAQAHVDADRAASLLAAIRDELVKR